MTNELVIDPRSRRMLELLAQGAGSKALAKELGYQEGTMRVYLHNLYRKIGVGNKTEAVIWYLKRSTPAAHPVPAEPVAARPSEDLLGDMALAEGLYAAFGVMGAFVGPYGRVWEVGMKLAGDEVGADKRARQARVRALWNALLRGDFAHGKQVYDQDEGASQVTDSPSDAMLLVALLAIGGYSSAARQLAARVTDRRRARATVTGRESALVRLMFDAFEDKDPQAAPKLQRAAADRAAPPASRQLALVLMFHAGRLRKETERARQAAHALWAEAEDARKELAAMGDRFLGARPATAPARAPAREKVAATR